VAQSLTASGLGQSRFSYLINVAFCTQMRAMSLCQAICLAFGFHLASAETNFRHTRVAPDQSGDVVQPLSTSLAIFASQCKCKFIGLCSCRASVEFMDCIADACASGSCDCHEHQFEEACGNMSATCPSIGVQCSKDKATCLHHSHAEDEPTADILSDLEEFRAKQCKLREAHKAGFLNADNRIRELKPRIQARIDALIIKGVPCTPNMECNKEPLCPEGGDEAAASPAPAAASSAKEAADEKKADKAEVETDTTKAKEEKEERDEKEEDKQPKVVPPPSKVKSLSEYLSLNNMHNFKICSWEVAVHVLLVLVFALLYNMHRAKWTSRDDVSTVQNTLNEQGFQFGLFGCWKAPLLTLFVCCCFPLRWADTMDKANDQGKFMSYWNAIILWLILEAASLFLMCMTNYGSITVDIILIIALAVGVFFRQKLRQKFNARQDARSYAEDILSWWCCPWCAVVQEARQVEYARKMSK